jgi:hypothetical protein|nr:MAG TPA: hypothetical protein [Caudoviricetes sp.]
MTQIIASPADLFAIARSHKPTILIVLPHAYEAVKSIRKTGAQYQFIKAAPSIAGKIALLSLEGAVETDEDLELFETLSPACGMKDGRIVNTTDHTLPFDDIELISDEPDVPASYSTDGYIVQRVDNEWYYYENVGTAEQELVLSYIHSLATLAATLKSELPK